MITRRSLIASAGSFALAGCSNKFRSYDGPPVTGLVAYKGQRRLYLMNDSTVLRDFRFQLGFAPEGHKRFEGDGKTPEGGYWIDRRNPNSAYHLSIGISYPNAADRAYAAQHGRLPGGDIFIHGTPPEKEREPDWTAGCIAVTNREIEDIYAMVPNGVPIWIYA